MAQTIHRISELVSDPNIHNGQPIIKDSQVRVLDIVRIYDPKDRQSAERVATQFGVSVGQVHAAMAFYYLHKAEFDEPMERDSKEANL